MTNLGVRVLSAALLAAFTGASGPLRAQTSAAPPEVSAAVVEYICDSGSASCASWSGPREHIINPTRYLCSFCTFTGLMGDAFGLQYINQMVNVPSALQVNRYRIEMTVSAPVDKATMLNLMWGVATQAFQVRSHVEERDVPTVALRVGKHGPKFKALDPSVPDEARHFEIGAGVMHFQTIAELVKDLNSPSTRAGRVVIDETGLTGRYDIELHEKDVDFSAPGTLLVLVKEQLGLDFVKSPRTAKVKRVVIDSAQPLNGKWVKP